jgi:predicted nucleotidyltransferase
MTPESHRMNAVRYVGFEIGRGGPRGARITAASLCERWNAQFVRAGLDIAIRPGRGSTGNYWITASTSLALAELSRRLDDLRGTRGFVVFPADDFSTWLADLERHLERCERPRVPPARRPTPGVVMNRDLTGDVPPPLPAPDPRHDPVEDANAWTSSDFGVARVRGAWKNDLLRADGDALDRERREGTWGALARAMMRAHGGRWTARSIGTLRGLEKALVVGGALQSGDRRARRIEQVLREQRETILSIAAKHGAKNVRVFGSVTRGEETDSSDVDLLVDVGPDPSPFFPGGLIAELEHFLGLRVDVLTERALHWYIRDRVVGEAVPL